MSTGPRDAQTLARYTLGLIRLAVGSMALLAPKKFARDLGVDPDTSPAVVYVSRLFGVRTVLIAFDVLLGDEKSRAQALRRGVFIHLSDIAAAALAGFGRQLPRKAAFRAVLISSINAGAAVLAQRRRL